MTRFNTVIAGPARKNDPQTLEALTGEAIKPCSLVAVAGGKLVKHATAGEQTQPLVMMYNYIGGGDIRNDVPLDTTGVAVICEDDVNYHVLVKAGETVVVGDKLTSNGDGTLKKAATDEAVIFYAMEDYTTTSIEQVRVRKA